MLGEGNKVFRSQKGLCTIFLSILAYYWKILNKEVICLDFDFKKDLESSSETTKVEDKKGEDNNSWER